MKKKFSVEQIESVLKQAEVGVRVAELIRKWWISCAAKVMTITTSTVACCSEQVTKR